MAGCHVTTIYVLRGNLRVECGIYSMIGLPKCHPNYYALIYSLCIHSLSTCFNTAYITEATHDQITI